MQRRARSYDKGGDGHYDTISAFIKTVRGSDPDAAVYCLARMIESGEDPLFIARRLVILASEDVGLADPRALASCDRRAAEPCTSSACPKASIRSRNATLYLATAPKSNTVGRAYGAALADVESDAQRSGADASAQRADAADEKSRIRQRLSATRTTTTPRWMPKATRRRPSCCSKTCPKRCTVRAYFQPGKQGDEARLRAWIDARRERRTADEDPLSRP